MKKEVLRDVLSVPAVADGNPSAAMALARQAQSLGREVDYVELTATSLAVNLFHGNMTSSPEAAREYTDRSEARRNSLPARAYALAGFLEFVIRCPKGDRPIRWNVMQEHQLLGASPRLLRMLGVEDIRLAVPDVYPKVSARIAAQKHPGTRVSVWNSAAYEELQAGGIRTELCKPYLLDSFRPDLEAFWGSGVTVVAKTSGNGMPADWQQALVRSLTETDQAWRMHTTWGNIGHDARREEPDRKERIEAFYGDLGGATRAIIGYPSELVEVTCEMRERGADTWLITLPPRGAHEKRNLQFAQDHGLVLGELAMGTAHEPTLEGLRQIQLSELRGVLDNLPQSSWSTGVVGSEPFWTAGSESTGV